MATKPNVTAMDLSARLSASIKGVKAHRAPFVPPPAKEDKEVPDALKLISKAGDRLKLKNLVRDYVEQSRIQSEAKKTKDAISEEVKNLCGTYQIGNADCDGSRINYYSQVRRSLNQSRLLKTAKITKDQLATCYDEKESYTLRISGPGDEGEESTD